MDQERAENAGNLGRAEGSRSPDPVRKKRKKKLVLALSALGIVLVLFVASVQLTSTSRFCAVCHYMKSFYESWKT